MIHIDVLCMRRWLGRYWKLALLCLLVPMISQAPPRAGAQSDDVVCGLFERATLDGFTRTFFTLDGAEQPWTWEIHDLAFVGEDAPIGQYARIWQPDVSEGSGYEGRPLVLGFSHYEIVLSCQPVETPQPVDAAELVADVTVPDGTTFGPKERFTKTWQVRNTGNTTWDSGYVLLFVSGNALGAGGTTRLTTQVPPGATLDISVKLTAPDANGDYTGRWMFSNAQRQLFGPQLTAVINVKGPPQLPAFKLPYAKGIKVYWTGGPHAYLLGGQFSALYPSGQGSGMDFSNGKSFQVLAMAAGKVIDASCDNPGLGCQVAIKHTIGGSVLVYGHLEEGSIAISTNQIVRQGTVLGMAGNTGSGGGPYIHLHVELRDGSGSCNVQCMPNKSFGNPIGWDDLVQLVDGWYIGGYLADAEGKNSRNYDGSAVRGTAIELIYNFPYIDNGQPSKVKVVRVHKGFKCKSAADCELAGNQTNPGGTTQFARDDGKGVAFQSDQTAQGPANQAGSLASSNTPK